MAKTFRLKRTARKYQKAHGGRIVGTTGAYQVKKNATRRKSRKRSGLKGAISSLLPNRVRRVRRPKGWIKAKAVKFERGKILIKR